MIKEFIIAEIALLPFPTFLAHGGCRGMPSYQFDKRGDRYYFSTTGQFAHTWGSYEDAEIFLKVFVGEFKLQGMYTVLPVYKHGLR